MTLMLARPWKHPKTGVYWYRRRVPTDLVEIFGRGEEKYSLRTKDPAEAKRLHADALANSARRWLALRKSSTPLSDEQILVLARTVYVRCLSTPTLLATWDIALVPMLFVAEVLPSGGDSA